MDSECDIWMYNDLLERIYEIGKTQKSLSFPIEKSDFNTSWN